MNQKDFPVNLKAAPLPAEKLLEAVRDAVGNLDELAPAPGKGKASKAKGKAPAKSKATTVEQRASERLMRRELRRQENLEAITRKALGALPALVAPEAVDTDWIVRFSGYCQDAGHDDMQSLWARLLAGEVTRPGTYSMRSLRVLRDMTRSDAQLFTALCRFVWTIPGIGLIPVVHDLKEKCFEEAGITQGTLGYLASLGLVTFNEPGSFNLQQISSVQAHYCGRAHTVAIAEGRKDLHVGRAILTDAGKTLVPVAAAPAHEAYRAAVVAHWRSMGWTVAE